MSKLTRTLFAVGLVGLFAVAMAPVAQAEQGQWLFKGGATFVSPKSDNLKFSDGEDTIVLNVDDGASFGFTISYMVTDNWAVELLAAVPFKHDIAASVVGMSGSEDIAEVTHLPPTLSLQYHFMPDGPFDPYVGVGINWTLFSSEKIHPDVADKLMLDDSTGLAAQIGADWYFRDQWFINLDLRYIDIGPDAKIVSDGTTISLGKVKINPFVYSLMLGYRF